MCRPTRSLSTCRARAPPRTSPLEPSGVVRASAWQAIAKTTCDPMFQLGSRTTLPRTGKSTKTLHAAPLARPGLPPPKSSQQVDSLIAPPRPSCVIVLQLEYAALDAWASLEVYRQLLSYPSAPAVLCNDGGKPCISAIPPAPYVMPAPPLQLQPDPLAVCTRTVPAALSNKSLHGANSTAAIGLPAKLVSHVASSTLAHEY